MSKCGWGLFAFDMGDILPHGKNVLLEAFGPTVIADSSPFWLGAARKTNNTAEFSAIIEALLLNLRPASRRWSL